MVESMKALRSFLVRQKMYFHRGYGLVGCLGIGYLVANKLQEQLVLFYGLQIPIKTLFPIGVIGLWVVGWLEFKSGAWRDEAKINWDMIPDKDKDAK